MRQGNTGLAGDAVGAARPMRLVVTTPAAGRWSYPQGMSLREVIEGAGPNYWACLIAAVLTGLHALVVLHS